MKSSNEYILNAFKEMIDSYNVKSTLFLCSSYRSGSSAISSLLKNQGFGDLGKERFNRLHNYMRLVTSNDKDLLTNFLVHIDGIIRASTTSDGILASKLMYPNKQCLFKILGLNPYKYDDLLSVFPGLEFIFVFRKELIDQSISFWRAKKTNLWHVYDKNIVKNQPKPEYDFDEILKSFKELRNHQVMWETFFEYIGKKPIIFNYNDLESPAQIIDRCMSDLNCTELIEKKENKKTKINLKKQGDEYNEIVKQQFIQDLLDCPYSKLLL